MIFSADQPWLWAEQDPWGQGPSELTAKAAAHFRVEKAWFMFIAYRLP